MSHWPLYNLGNVIQQRKDFILIDELPNINVAAFSSMLKVLFYATRFPAPRFKTKKQQICKAGDFLVAEIDAKVGGFGIVPES